MNNELHLEMVIQLIKEITISKVVLNDLPPLVS